MLDEITDLLYLRTIVSRTDIRKATGLWSCERCVIASEYIHHHELIIILSQRERPL